MTEPPTPAVRPTLLELIALAGRTAASGRRVQGKDPLLLLFAARLERRVGVEELAALDGTVSPAPASTLRAAGRDVDGLLGFEALLQEALESADGERPMVDSLVTALRQQPPSTPAAQRWSGGLQGRTSFTARLRRVDPKASGVSILWASASPARLDVMPMSGPVASLDIDGAAGFLPVAATSDDVVVRIINCGDRPARFSLVMRGLAPSRRALPS